MALEVSSGPEIKLSITCTIVLIYYTLPDIQRLLPHEWV